MSCPVGGLRAAPPTCPYLPPHACVRPLLPAPTGPVVAAVCVLPPDVHVPGIDDSKALTEARREAAYHVLTTHPRIQWATCVLVGGRGRGAGGAAGVYARGGRPGGRWGGEGGTCNEDQEGRGGGHVCNEACGRGEDMYVMRPVGGGEDIYVMRPVGGGVWGSCDWQAWGLGSSLGARWLGRGLGGWELRWLGGKVVRCPGFRLWGP